MLKYSKVLAAAAIAASLGIGMTAKAATVTYTLVIDQNNGLTTGVPGTWTLYADDSVGDNFGIASLQVGMLNTLTSINDLPKLTYTDSGGGNNDVNAGFTLLRSGNGEPPKGSMDTTASKMVLITGFGQTAGTFPTATSLAPVAGEGWDNTQSATQVSWAAHLKIAHGTYTIGGPAPTIDPGLTVTAANVLSQVPPYTNPINSNTLATIQAQIVIGGPVITPEPASLGIIALGGLALLARRRKIA